MNTRAKNFLRGVGSVMDLAPARDLRKMAPRRSPSERMASHFAHAGEAITRACGTFDEHGAATTAKAKAA